jgi:hypothetical protein
MLWSVTLTADGDRALTREEIVELADAVAVHSGVASGIGSTHYGARLVVAADGKDEALERAGDLFTAAAAQAGLPMWPISHAEAISEQEELDAEQDGWVAFG